jgi:hypothetical protein
MKYEVCIEYGPTAADVHYITVDADSVEDALDQGKKWAEDNRIRNAMVSNAIEFPTDIDDFSDIIEWTPEEEEAFLHILDDSGDDNGTV